MQPSDSGILSFFAKFVESELGIVYADQNYFQLQNRLEEIAKLLGVASIESLHELAKKGINGAFKQLLLDVATNNETSFFRDPKVFRAIENIVLNSFLEKQFKSDKLRIWSAASSTGQEALSIAMMIHEYNAKAGSSVRFSITGTDISERVLMRARSSTYTQLEIQRGLPAPYLVKYFKKDEQDMWRANSEITRDIQYKKQNLKEPFLFSEPFHLILCRNVLIYQSVEGKKEVLNRMTSVLAPGGILILGSGESLLGLSNQFEMVAIEGAIIYKKHDVFTKAA